MYELDAPTIVLSVLMTWGFALTPPLVIRYVLLRRPIGAWSAIGICGAFWVFNVLFFIALGSKSKTHGGLVLAAMVSYWILRRVGPDLKKKERLGSAPISSSTPDIADSEHITSMSQQSTTAAAAVAVEEEIGSASAANNPAIRPDSNRRVPNWLPWLLGGISIVGILAAIAIQMPKDKQPTAPAAYSESAAAPKKLSDAANSPRSGYPTPSAAAVEWIKKAVELEEKNDLSGLITAAEEFVKKDSTDEFAWSMLGSAHNKFGNFQKAVKAYEQALRLDPNSKAAWGGLGRTYISLKEYAKAIESFQQASRVDSQNAEIWYTLGGLYSLFGPKEKTIDAYKKLQALDPNKASEFSRQYLLP